MSKINAPAFFKLMVSLGGALRFSEKTTYVVIATSPHEHRLRRVLDIYFDSCARAQEFADLLEKHDEQSPNRSLQYRAFVRPITKDDKRPVIKFSSHHFPAGTLFMCEDLMTINPAQRKTKIFETSAVVENGIRSFVAVTAETDETLGIKRSYNLSHVTRIIKRGEGPMVDENAMNFITSRNRQEQQSTFCIRQRWDFDGKYSPKGRGAYLTGSLNILLRDLFAEMGLTRSFQNTVSINIAAEAIQDQTWCKRKGWGKDYWPIYSINKKRLKRFVQQNYNRWLRDLDTLEQQESDTMIAYYERTLDADMDLVNGAYVPEFAEHAIALNEEAKAALIGPPPSSTSCYDEFYERPSDAYLPEAPAVSDPAK